MSMFDDLSPIYSQIVIESLKVAPSDWIRLWLACECNPGVYVVGAYFEQSDTDVVKYVRLPSLARSLVYDAWEISCSYNDRWSTAIFRLDRPDKLNITFGHEDLDDESVTSMDRRGAFRSKMFGARKIVSEGYDMSGAVKLTKEMLESDSLLESKFGIFTK